MARGFSKVAYGLALCTAIAIAPLGFVGAGVTSKDAGMAYPDWPASDGHYVNPPGWWQGEKTRWEHGHRLLGWTVGMLAIVSAVAGIWAGGIARVLAPVTLAAIIVQGVLGGFRVNEISTTLAMVHGIWGQMCFSLAVLVVLFSSRTWTERRVIVESVNARFLQRLCAVGTGLLIVQLTMGAALRHFNASWALVGHLLGAVVVAFTLGWICMWVLGAHSDRAILAKPAKILGALLVVQLMAGGFAFLVTTMPAMKWSPLMLWLVPTVHVVVGAAMLAMSICLATAAFGTLRAAPVQGDGVERLMAARVS